MNNDGALNNMVRSAQGQMNFFFVYWIYCYSNNDDAISCIREVKKKTKKNNNNNKNNSSFRDVYLHQSKILWPKN